MSRQEAKRHPDRGSKDELPEHLEASVAGISEFHAEHHRQATRSHRLVLRLVCLIGSPGAVGFISALVVAWVIVNAYLGRAGMTVDPPPFPLLADILQVAAFFVMILILITQRYDARLAEYREQLTLQLAILADQRNAKIIELIETLRRDSSTVADRVDHQAAILAIPTNPESLLKAIKNKNEDGSMATEKHRLP